MITAELFAGRLVAGTPGELTVRLSNTGTGPCTKILFKLRLPAQVISLGGNDRIEVLRLDPGESRTVQLQVRPSQPGEWTATSTNFSYRDHWGTSNRRTDFAAVLRVVPKVAQPVAKPSYELTLITRELPYDEWDTLTGYVTNTGVAPLSRVTVALSGRVERHTSTARLGPVLPGDRGHFTFPVAARESGRTVPLGLGVTCVDAFDNKAEFVHKVSVAVHRTAEASTGKVRILYLAANPTRTDQLGLDRELRGIKETLRAGKDRDRFELDDHSAVRLKDMMQALLDFSPSVVHLSGHGTEDGRFLAETDAGAAKIVAVDGMAALFREFADTIRCVIVNACHSETLAQALVEHVDHVIGMRSRIGDRSAITFSVGFYQALAAGRPIDKAFSVGCAAIALHDKEGKGGDIPKLFRR